jgi:hypothetical protein
LARCRAPGEHRTYKPSRGQPPNVELLVKIGELMGQARTFRVPAKDGTLREMTTPELNAFIRRETGITPGYLRQIRRRYDRIGTALPAWLNPKRLRIL